ncbi:Hypothetical Protein FCC1311_055482 [Hondaea fermentalgiana]|uniref:Uncharacterized protein n=1 Tax=Hondaea fermentalgiana TaxID=2315210 RepID=A0A2R5GEG6_9STRA|nr:Hypothetical Protein FCC1311_055482 [Hondaea fermentalgiana]|eukprot:GBG29326.1 Hypothetical Protein FCC1311_055482 [Hondaea fermentalgiana]
MAAAKDTCPRSALVRILSYECSPGDVAINYALVAWSTVLCAEGILAAFEPATAAKSDTSSGGSTKSQGERPGDADSRRTGRAVVWAVNAYLWGFQIGLCLAVDCVGISIVWSAHAGILIALARSLEIDATPFLRQKLRNFAGACIAAWTYYALVEPPITTVAHAAAVAMGLGIGDLIRRWAYAARRS